MENADHLTLEKKVNEAKKFYLEKYGELDWHWTDEGLVYAIQDYHSSMGDFSLNDRKFADDNGFGDVLRWVEDED